MNEREPNVYDCGLTWVEEDDGSQAAQLCFIHLHVPHLAHQLRQHPDAIKMRAGRSEG